MLDSNKAKKHMILIILSVRLQGFTYSLKRHLVLLPSILMMQLIHIQALERSTGVVLCYTLI